MCFPKFQGDENKLSPLYNEDGELNTDESYLPVHIPPGLQQHSDNLFLNSDINLEYSILGFVYESSYEVLIVYTSDEAEELCEEIITGQNTFKDNQIQEDQSSFDPFADDSFDEVILDKFNFEEGELKKPVEDLFDEYYVEDPFEDYPLEEYSSEEYPLEDESSEEIDSFKVIASEVFDENPFGIYL